MNLQDVELDITLNNASRIDQVDFDNLVFGKHYTDHMLICDYVDGQWQTPKITPYGPMQMQPSSKVFHYGQAVFEGMKAFKDDQDKVWLFRPEDNFKRINISSKRMAIPEFPKEYFFSGLKKLLELDHKWVQKGQGNSLYIRPFAMAIENGVSAAPSNAYRFMIICCPAKAYYSEAIKVLIAQEYSRSADGGVGFAKAAGNYGAQFYPTNLAREKGYQQIIWTDAKTHEYLEEAGTMNIFFRIGDKLITAPTSDRILDGITRKSLIDLARHKGVEVEVRRIKVSEIVEAHQNGLLKEIFGTGTAATIAKISGFEYDNKLYDLPEVENPYSVRFKKALQDIQYNRSEDPFNWRFSFED
ncbi:branched-chain amino acid aminotransferase [Mesonia sp. K7]|uniref:branched-chain amino acid aminotransferase n=1 Tax=Mesonia sp. K7 TaxID=2218606 RepID=UPI000DAAAC6E|nr:branched-chain amino acid aminotransferase [Mesonia sp. K7]PZD79597.1 branched chain amino acid aminotransferase [Mesonia sp. K7]